VDLDHLDLDSTERALEHRIEVAMPFDHGRHGVAGFEQDHPHRDEDSSARDGREPSERLRWGGRPSDLTPMPAQGARGAPAKANVAQSD
jgi:hypothetical protein